MLARWLKAFSSSIASFAKPVDKAELEEEMIRFFQHEKPKPVEEEPIIDVDSFNNKQQKHEAEIEEIFSKEVDTDK